VQRELPYPGLVKVPYGEDVRTAVAALGEVAQQELALVPGAYDYAVLVSYGVEYGHPYPC